MNVAPQRKSLIGSYRNSQEVPLLRIPQDTNEEDEEAYIKKLTNEVLRPHGCCLAITGSLIWDKITHKEIDEDGKLKGKKLVHYLAIHNRAEDISRVINIGRQEHNFNEPDDTGHPPLFLAVAKGCKDAVKSILEYPGIEDSFGFVSQKHSCTILHRIAMNGFDGICDTVLAACPSKTLKEIIDLKELKGRTALHIAAKGNHAAIVRSLVQKGANYKLKDSKGRTPLMVAPNKICKTHAKDALINAESIAQEAQSVTSNLLSYIAKGRYKEAKSLIDAGCALDIVDEYGNGPFLCVIKSKLNENKMLKLIQLIRASNDSTDDLNRKNASDETILIITIKKGFNLILEEITNKMSDTSQSIDLDQSDIPGNTALHLAVKQKNNFAIKRLLEVGANSSLQNSAGDTPLHCAVRLKYKFAITSLLEAGANINLQNSVGNTPLHLSKDYEITDALLEYAPDTTLKNQAGSTPLDCAIRRENSDQNATKILAAGPAVELSEAAALYGNSETSGYCAKREKEEKITSDDILPLSEKKSDAGKVGKNFKKQIREHGEKIAKKKMKELLDTTDNVGSKAIQGGEKVATKVIEVTVDGATDILENGKEAATEIVKVVKDGAVETVTFGRDTGLDIIKTSVAMAKPATIAGGLLTDALEKGRELAKKDIDKWGSKKNKAEPTNTNEAIAVEEKEESKEE